MMPSDMAPPPPAPVARHSFACAKCGQAAGLVQLFGPASAGEIVRESFTSRSTYPVGPESFERLRTSIKAGDVRALYKFDLEMASFYCPDCHACYCGEHWARWNVFDDEEGFTWHDSIRGRCPSGHQRMLED
jgi:hypothetical protein